MLNKEKSMKWLKIYKESEEEEDIQQMSMDNFDYARLVFPDKTDAQIKESSGGEYEMYSEEFDYLNEDLLGNASLSFVIEAEVEGHWYGKYYPATRESPEEFPEFEVDDSSSELVHILLAENKR